MMSIPDLEAERNQWEQHGRFCLLSTSLTASLARHGGQAPGRKHGKNTRMITASRGLNVYNAVLKSASRLSTYKGTFEGRRSRHSRAGNSNETCAPLHSCLRTKQEEWGFHHPHFPSSSEGLGRRRKPKCSKGRKGREKRGKWIKVAPRLLLHALCEITGTAQSVNITPALLLLSLQEWKEKRWWNRRQHH